MQRRKRFKFAARLLAAVATMAGVANAQQRPPAANPGPAVAPDPASALPARPKPASVKGDFAFSVVGDLLMPRPIPADPALARVAEVLTRDDLTLGNQEGVFVDRKAFHGPGYGAGLLIGEDGVAVAEKALGVQMVSVANNHATDWGRDGLSAMLALLDKAGVAHAGYGANREAAYKATIVETPKGRVGLVAAASTFKINAGALDAGDDTAPRPGLAILRTRQVRYVSGAAFADLSAFADKSKAGRKGPRPGELTVGGQTFKASDAPGSAGLHFEMNLYDHHAILKSIREAKAKADMVVFTIHTHESLSGTDDGPDTAPADFLPRLFHDAVDAGADVVTATGGHITRGVEIYKGKPIFYGLASFAFRGDRRWLPDSLQANAYPGAPVGSYGVVASYLAKDFSATAFDGIMATTVFDGDVLKEVRIYPLDLGQTEDWTRRGVPHLADGATARRILATLQKDSAPFGTRIEIEGSVGVIRPAAPGRP